MGLVSMQYSSSRQLLVVVVWCWRWQRQTQKQKQLDERTRDGQTWRQNTLGCWRCSKSRAGPRSRLATDETPAVDPKPTGVVVVEEASINLKQVYCSSRAYISRAYNSRARQGPAA